MLYYQQSPQHSPSSSPEPGGRGMKGHRRNGESESSDIISSDDSDSAGIAGGRKILGSSWARKDPSSSPYRTRSRTRDDARAKPPFLRLVRVEWPRPRASSSSGGQRREMLVNFQIWQPLQSFYSVIRS